MGDLTFKEADTVLRYSKRTGLLVWKRRPEGPKQWNSCNAGKVAGTRRKDGCIQISVGGKLYQAARVAWTLATGAPPPVIVDHKNGMSDDNRWRNLRLASNSENHRNSRARGEWPKGVYRNNRGIFVAQIKYNGVNHYLGSFTSAEAAHKRYMREARRVFGRFACARG